jgi:hypothetical protein
MSIHTFALTQQTNNNEEKKGRKKQTYALALFLVGY